VIDPDTYFLLYHHSLDVSSDAVRTIQTALRYTPEESQVLTFYHQISTHEIYAPQYSSFGQFIDMPHQETCFAIALSGAMLNDFLEHYHTTPSGVSTLERTAEHFFAACTYVTLLGDHQILPIPKILASGNISYGTLKLTEKNFFDFAHYVNTVNWDKFRYSALIRHVAESSDKSAKSQVIDTQTDEFLSAQSKSSRAVRRLLRHQVSFVIAVKKLKRRLFP
jgi:hypothetical protein